MNQQEVNTALYNKLAAEQAEYRKWLLTQPPEEIVGRAYEYTLREDILTAAEQLELSKAQALELLAANSPMEAICQQFRSWVSAVKISFWIVPLIGPTLRSSPSAKLLSIPIPAVMPVNTGNWNSIAHPRIWTLHVGTPLRTLSRKTTGTVE